MSGTWKMPVILGVLTIMGLIGALFGDGLWDWLSALALAVPVFVGSWHALRPSPVSRASTRHPRKDGDPC